MTLALVIGANSAIFSLFNALVLRPLPIPQPEQLVGLLTVSSDSVNGDDALTLPMFQELRRHQDVLTDLFASNAGGVDNVEVNGRHYTVSGANVSGGYYNALRIAPVLGRFITDSDVAIDSGTSNAVAVISYRSWRSWYRVMPRWLAKPSDWMGSYLRSSELNRQALLDCSLIVAPM